MSTVNTATEYDLLGELNSKSVDIISIDYQNEEASNALQSTNKSLNSEKGVVDTVGIDEIKDVGSNSIESSSIIITRPLLNFDNVKLVTGSWREFCQKRDGQGMFLKGCKWSPDGTCLLTNNDDAIMRLFDLPLDLYNRQQLNHIDYPELSTSLSVKVSGIVYDYAWYPLMTSTDSQTCCFITTSFFSPIHMWDAFTGKLRCSYLGYNTVDEMVPALSLTFNPIGDLLFSGYKDGIRIFNTDVPGRNSKFISTKELSEQKGIISCIAVNDSLTNIFAAGTYSKSVGLYSVDGHAICLLTGQSGGLTQVQFSQDGSRLFSAGRKDSEILCWDLRNLGRVLYSVTRPHITNQRVYFDLSNDDQYLISGSTDGIVRVWNIDSSSTTSDATVNECLKPVAQWRASNDCVNGISVHRHIPVVATASGQRFLPEFHDGDDEDLLFDTKRPHDRYEDSVKLWWCGSVLPAPTD